MKKTTFVLSCALALTYGVAGVAMANDDTPDPNEIHITDIGYGGSGCPGGSASVNLAGDGQAFTVIFDEFVAEIGPGIPLSKSRRNCQLNLTLHVPQGFTFAIASVDYRGFADIAKGATGMQKAIYYFQGQAPQASTWRLFKGVWDTDWHLRDEVELAALVFAPCGVTRAVNINADLRLDKGTSGTKSSFMTMDSEDGNIEQVFHLAWKRCGKGD